MIAAYITGHGFGHATRTAEVLRHVRQRSPEPITVVAAAPERLFRSAIGGDLAVRHLACDVGLAQKDALTIDEAATVLRCREFAARWPALVSEEARWLRAAGARVVLGDIPPLAFAAAREAGLPAIALGNFSWDWIYRHMAARHPALGEAADRAAEAYASAALLLELPFAGDLSAFPRRERIPLLARRPRVDKAEARRRLGLGTRPAVLVSFGGLGLPGFRGESLAGLSGFDFLTSDPLDAARPRSAPAPGPIGGRPRLRRRRRRGGRRDQQAGLRHRVRRDRRADAPGLYRARRLSGVPGAGGGDERLSAREARVERRPARAAGFATRWRRSSRSPTRRRGTRPARSSPRAG